MIARTIRYAGPNAAIRARFGGLLAPDEYRLLLNAVDVHSFLSLLRTTSYGSALDVAGRSFDFAIHQHWIARAQKVAGLLPRAARELCLAYVAKAEIDALKTLLRGFARGIDRRRLASMIGPLPAAISFPLKTLIAASDLEGALRVLERTVYGKTIAHAMAPGSVAGGKEPTLPVLLVERALDRWFFARLIDAGRFSSGSERSIVERLLGALADAANILAVQRLKSTFHLEPDAAAAYLVPHGFRLNARKRRALCEWSGEGMPPLVVGSTVSGASLSVTLLRTLCAEAARPLFAVPFQAGVAISYLLLTEMEAADMVAIWEGKSWEIGRGELADRMIRFSPIETGLARV